MQNHGLTQLYLFANHLHITALYIAIMRPNDGYIQPKHVAELQTDKPVVKP